MNVASKPSTHKAAGQYLGYSEQEARFCYYLLTSPDDAVVVMEGEDDVAVRFSNGEKILEQVKSATKHNALADWSKDLWKTIGNWIADIESGVVDLHRTLFRLYVTPIHSGEIANAIHSASDEQSVSELKSLILSKRDALPRKPNCNKHVEAFLGLEEGKLSDFLSRISIESVHSRPERSVNDLWGPTCGDETKQRLTSFAIGTARNKANGQIKKGEEGTVNAGSFLKEIQLFAARLNLPNFLTTTSSEPPEDAVASVHAQRPMFVRQLEIIDVGQDQETRAVADFLRASADKTIWAEEGDIVQGDLDDLDTTLVRFFQLHKGEVEDIHGTLSEETQGRQILRLCLRAKAKLAGQEVPDHFIPGSYHELADELQSGVGWHPNHQTILSEDE